MLSVLRLAPVATTSLWTGTGALAGADESRDVEAGAWSDGWGGARVGAWLPGEEETCWVGHGVAPRAGAWAEVWVDGQAWAAAEAWSRQIGFRRMI